MSYTTDTMAIYRRRKQYAKSKYKAWYKNKYGKEPDREALKNWEVTYRRKKLKAKGETATFQGRLNLLMTEYGITHLQLSQVMYKSESAIDKWCSGKSYPHFYDLILLSDYFDVTTDYLLKGE